MKISKTFSLFIILLVLSCSSPNVKKQAALYQKQCASCHLAPSINDLPKDIWAEKILPDMGARMGIKDTAYNPMKGLSYSEQNAINQTGIYPLKPRMSKSDWLSLKEYIISMAPDSLRTPDHSSKSSELIQFLAKPISLDSTEGSLITFLEYDNKDNNLKVGDIAGNLSKYNFIENKSSQIGQFGSAVIAHTQNKKNSYTTAIGKLDPSEFSSGSILTLKDGKINPIVEMLHRPVNTLVIDLNKDGKEELVVSEFGNLTGKLSLFTKTDSAIYKKSILLNQPGTIRVLSKDMDNNGKDDLIALTSQGDETITILYQQDDLRFIAEKVIRFSPIYGSSWFELIDYDGDGDNDIITVNGDNADKSYVQKPYHGLRIHINDGKNNFEEKYFYALNGATRLVARDFDKDGDVDFGVISTFPDYENYPEFSFVYLENVNSKTYTFNPFTFKDSKMGRWFLMDAGDIDNDGDDDIILSSFTYVFTPVPDELAKYWNEKNVDLMVLENKLKN
jgi:hypothetical protein